MSNRRRFIFLSSAAASLPLASTLLTQTSLAHAAIPFSEAELVRQMTAKLTLELSDATTASTEVGYLNDLFFNWEAASIAASQADSILVFGFGGRSSGSGASTQVASGPVNAVLRMPSCERRIASAPAARDKPGTRFARSGNVRVRI